MSNPSFVKLEAAKELRLLCPELFVSFYAYPVGGVLCAQNQAAADGLIENEYAVAYSSGAFVPLKVANNPLSLTWVDPETEEGRTVLGYEVDDAVLAPDTATATAWVQAGYCQHFTEEQQ